MRVALLGLSHEANSFSVHPADNDYVETIGVQRGPEIVERHTGGTSTISGFLVAAEHHEDVEIVPLVMTNLIPRGPLTAGVRAMRTRELVNALASQGPFDAVLASLHGAAVADDVLDVDGDLLSRFREVVGPEVPIGVSLDLHANISEAMCRNSDVLNTYRTNPHVDAMEVADEVAELIFQTVRGEVRPTQAFVPIPAVINILCQNTDVPPMNEIIRELGEVRALPGVLSATVAEGYQYADVPEMGMSVVVVTDDDPDAAAAHARELAAKVWARRGSFDTRVASADVAIELVRSAAATPVLLLDVGDNIGGGAPGDSVALLNAARAASLESVLTIVHDPAAAELCTDSGVGAEVHLEIGAHTDPATGPSVVTDAVVLALHEGVTVATESVHAGMSRFDAGPTAAVRLSSGQTVIVTSRVVLPLSTVQITSLGLEPSQFRAIIAKGVHSPIAGYGPHVAKMVLVDTPGITSANLRRFAYRHRRAVYPLDAGVRFPPDHGAP